MSYSLYYASDQVYQTILRRIHRLGYNVQRSDANKNEIEVTRWFFPLIKRKFNITVIRVNEYVSTFSVIQTGGAHRNNRYEKQLNNLLSFFF